MSYEVCGSTLLSRCWVVFDTCKLSLKVEKFIPFYIILHHIVLEMGAQKLYRASWNGLWTLRTSTSCYNIKTMDTFSSLVGVMDYFHYGYHISWYISAIVRVNL
jgi:hypothetical protein